MTTSIMRPVAPPADSWRNRTLAELMNLSIDKGAYEVGRTAWLARALITPLWQLGAIDIRLLLHHDRGAVWLLPEVLQRLEFDPLTPIEDEAGALLMAACVVDPMTWASEPDWIARFADIRRAARRLIATMPHDLADPLIDELDAADDVFAG